MKINSTFDRFAQNDTQTHKVSDIWYNAESSLVSKTAADGFIFSTSPSSCCTVYVSVLHRRDIEQIHIWKMMPWMVTHKDLKPHTNLLPTLFQTNALVLPL